MGTGDGASTHDGIGEGAGTGEGAPTTGTDGSKLESKRQAHAYNFFQTTTTCLEVMLALVAAALNSQ